ncbi:MAG: nucleotidyl transferase, partial [Gemmatimonadetes bacterium]|nr:nucleotidyl transferase [Gemmatimonadota bacterium]
YMIDHGAKLKVVDVAGWYDAGKLDTLLDTNRVMLGRGRALRPAERPDVRITDPVRIEEGVVLERCSVGPNVTIGTGSVVRDSTLRGVIVGEKSRVERCTLTNSMIGDSAVIEAYRGEVSIGDHSELRGA